jgi:hypothetical protein
LQIRADSAIRKENMNKLLKSQKQSDELIHRARTESEYDLRLKREQLIVNELYDQVRKGNLSVSEFRELLQGATGTKAVAAGH